MKTEYPTEIEKLLASLAEWRNSAASHDRKIDALHRLAGRAHDLIQPAPGLPAAEPIPAGYFWDHLTIRFYDMSEFLAPHGFHEQWIARKDEFPRSAEEARELADRLAPKPGLVPLGDNVTAAGHKARVLCIDAQAQGYPVVAEITNPLPVSHKIAYFTKTGEPCGANPDDRLIGHLPPEPPKPREIWIDMVGSHSLEKPADGLGYTLYREVSPE